MNINSVIYKKSEPSQLSVDSRAIESSLSLNETIGKLDLARAEVESIATVSDHPLFVVDRQSPSRYLVDNRQLPVKKKTQPRVDSTLY